MRHQEARGPGKGTIRSVFPCFLQQIRYSSDSTSELSTVKPKFGSEFRNVIVSDPAKCRIYVLHNHRRQIRNGQGAHSGPMARVLRPPRAAIPAGLRPAPAGRPRPSKRGADRHQCPFQVLMWGTGRWVAYCVFHISISIASNHICRHTLRSHSDSRET